MTCVEIGIGDNCRLDSRCCHCTQFSTTFIPSAVAVERNLFSKELRVWVEERSDPYHIRKSVFIVCLL
jgi:hypothetical protein